MSRKYGQITHGHAPASDSGPAVYGRGGWEVRQEGMPSSGSFRRPRNDTSRSEPYTPRRTSRFDQQGVLSSLISAPQLPSPAITPRVLDGSTMNPSAAHKMSPLGPQTVSMTPRHSNMQALALGQPYSQPYSPDAGGGLERSTWLPSPRASIAGSFRFVGPEMSVDGSFISKQVLRSVAKQLVGCARLECPEGWVSQSLTSHNAA
jgi:hypothetical protein